VAAGPKSPLKVGAHVVYFGGTDFGGLAQYKKIDECILPNTEEAHIFWTDRFFFDARGAAVVEVDPDLLGDFGSVLEPLTCALRAFFQHPPQPGHVGVVLGCGPIGSLAVQIMKKVFGVRKVIALDVQDVRLEHIKKLGADYTFNISKPAVQAELKEWVNKETGEIADYVFEALPPEQDKSVDPRYYGALLLKPGGSYLLFSAEGLAQSTSFWWFLLSKGLKLCAAAFDIHFFPMQKSAAVLHQAYTLVKTGVIDLKPLVSRVIAYKDADAVNKAFQTYGEGDVYKTIIKWH